MNEDKKVNSIIRAKLVIDTVSRLVNEVKHLKSVSNMIFSSNVHKLQNSHVIVKQDLSVLQISLNDFSFSQIEDMKNVMVFRNNQEGERRMHGMLELLSISEGDLKTMSLSKFIRDSITFKESEIDRLSKLFD